MTIPYRRLKAVCVLQALVIAFLLYSRVPQGPSVEQQRLDFDRQQVALKQQQLADCVAKQMTGSMLGEPFAIAGCRSVLGQ